MILQRLTAAVKEQRWFAVFLEFVIVLSGVVAGFQITAWNESRNERRLETQYYNEILLDLQQDLATAAIVQQVSDLNTDHNNRVTAALDGDESALSDPGLLAISVIRAGYAIAPRTTRSAFDELISTGRIGLLTNDILRREIRNYYSQMDSLRQWDGLLRQVQVEYSAATNGLTDRSVWLMAQTTPDLPEANVRQMIEDARQRPELRGVLDRMANIQIRFKRDAIEMAEAADALVMLIEAELAT